uniref:DUF4908 domain-containing protein n=1 Tax=Phenylobacterium glaciei TaxID=2803784 RepID=A0A974S8S5_9CAUL|nr:DUF4908 domain-containing protein [Phenylobacterium glaciei]
MTGLFAAPAWAGPDNLRESLFGQHPAAGRSQSPPVARYVSQEGDVFVLDRSQNRPLLKFQDSPEVWALKPQPPRAATSSTRTTWASRCCAPPGWAA